MFEKPLLKETLFSSALIAILHFLALKFYLYWNVWWFDIPMHFLGGLVIALFAMFIFYTSNYFDFPKEHKGSIFIMTIGSVLLIGLFWELWELFMGFSDVIEDQTDTFIDLIMDSIGGFAAYLYGKKFIWKGEN